METIYIQRVWPSINPAQPRSGDDTVAYVLKKVSELRSRPTRVITSAYSSMVNDVWLGSLVQLRNEELRYLGTYKVVGVHDFRGGRKMGEVPDLPLVHGVPVPSLSR